MNTSDTFDLIVIGSGAAGMMAAITAAKHGKRVILLEKLSKPGAKLKATGGGRCNLTNTLDQQSFMERFGRDGRFMMNALDAFGFQDLIDFFKGIGVQTHAPDGYRVFPVTHNAQTILSALEKELERLNVTLLCNERAQNFIIEEDAVIGVETQEHSFYADHVVVATGGLGYPQLGAEGDGHEMAKNAGHRITPLHPAMMPLHTKERWVENCRADTIAKATIRVDLPKAKKLRAQGDLIFTKHGIRGPVVLDFSREITPLLEKYGEVPLLVNMTKGMNEDELLKHLQHTQQQLPQSGIVDIVATLLPTPLAKEICMFSNADLDLGFQKQSGAVRDRLIKNLAWTPLTVTGHDGFKMAMITRGGISLKDINPQTMQSKRVKGLYFCGEVMNIDGPCGGYNLQWSFSSGFLAGQLLN